jgi:hypothetical protein
VQTNEEVAIKLVSTMSSSVAIDCLKCLVFLLPRVMKCSCCLKSAIECLRDSVGLSADGVNPDNLFCSMFTVSSSS